MLRDVIDKDIRIINEYLYLKAGEEIREAIIPLFKNGFILFRVKHEKSSESNIALATNYGKHQRLFSELSDVYEFYGFRFALVVIGKHINGWSKQDEICLLLINSGENTKISEAEFHEMAKEISAVHKVTDFIVRNPQGKELYTYSYNLGTRELQQKILEYKGIKSLEESIRHLFSLDYPIYIKGTRVNNPMNKSNSLEKQGLIIV